MSNKPMLQELTDNELEMVSGARHFTTVNLHVTIIENNYNIVYAPVYVYGTISNSNVDNGNTYIQNNRVSRYYH